MDAAKGTQTLKKLFESQKLAVLATQDRGQPHTSLVAFAATDDLKHLVFATARATRKFTHITADARVAMLVDDRSDHDPGFQKTVAVTAVGKGSEAGGDRRRSFVDLYLNRHPHLKEFIESPDCAIVDVSVETYYLVSSFQEVTELRPE